MTIASVKGGKIPIDEASLQGDFFTPDAKRFWSDRKPQIPPSDW